jgi:hypothetical protein
MLALEQGSDLPALPDASFMARVTQTR